MLEHRRSLGYAWVFELSVCTGAAATTAAKELHQSRAHSCFTDYVWSVQVKCVRLSFLYWLQWRMICCVCFICHQGHHNVHSCLILMVKWVSQSICIGFKGAVLFQLPSRRSRQRLIFIPDGEPILTVVYGSENDCWGRRTIRNLASRTCSVQVATFLPSSYWFAFSIIKLHGTEDFFWLCLDLNVLGVMQLHWQMNICREMSWKLQVDGYSTLADAY